MMTSPNIMYNVFDRTRSMIDIQDIEVLTPIGKLTEPLSIEELCYNSAKNILEQAGSRQIAVTWSGGIDSTLALSELLKLAPKEQLTVLMDTNSIKEYPQFYIKYIENQIRTMQMDFYTDNPIKAALLDGIVVTGHLLDPVFGTSLYLVLPEYRLKQGISEFIKELDITTQESYTKLINACPRSLITVKDFLWWMEYALNYQSEQLMDLLGIDEMILDQNLFHFGAGSDWNNYAVSTPAELKYSGYDLNNYKMPLKTQLYNFTKDKDYTNNKQKVASWRRYRTEKQRKQQPIFITTNWKREFRV